jgi:hypothetical protein
MQAASMISNQGTNTGKIGRPFNQFSRTDNQLNRKAWCNVTKGRIEWLIQVQ